MKNEYFWRKVLPILWCFQFGKNYDDHYSYEGYVFKETYIKCWICKSCFKKYAKLNVVYCCQHKCYSYPCECPEYDKNEYTKGVYEKDPHYRECLYFKRIVKEGREEEIHHPKCKCTCFDKNCSLRYCLCKHKIHKKKYN